MWLIALLVLAISLLLARKLMNQYELSSWF